MKIDVLGRAKKKKFIEGHASQGWGGRERLGRIATTVVVTRRFRDED